jgi:hypothetical protein
LKNDAIDKNRKVKLCPKIGDWADVTGGFDATWIDNKTLKDKPNADASRCLHGAERTTGPGYGYSGDPDNIEDRTWKQFATTYLNNAPPLYKKYGPTVAAIMAKESGLAGNALAWDNCYKRKEDEEVDKSIDFGALGLFQYDIDSRIDPLPVSPKAQMEQFFKLSPDPSGLPNILNAYIKWMACGLNNTAGARPGKMKDFKKALEIFKSVNPNIDYVTTPILPQLSLHKEVECKFGKDIPNRCGKNWADANDNPTNQQCMTKEDCPSGQECYNGMNK